MYLRDFECDECVVKEVNVDYLFYFLVEEMYKLSCLVVIIVIDCVDVLCGQKCFGYFDGVVMVLIKFFYIVISDCVYFGKKDVQ